MGLIFFRVFIALDPGLIPEATKALKNIKPLAHKNEILTLLCRTTPVSAEIGCEGLNCVELHHATRPTRPVTHVTQILEPTTATSEALKCQVNHVLP